MEAFNGIVVIQSRILAYYCIIYSQAEPVFLIHINTLKKKQKAELL